MDTIEQHTLLKFVHLFSLYCAVLIGALLRHDIAAPVVNIDYYRLTGSTEDPPTYRATFEIKQDPAKVARLKASRYDLGEFYDPYDSDMEDEDDMFGHMPWFDSDDEYGYY